VTLLLGHLAAWHHDCDSASSNVLNKMVLTCTLRLSLFAGMVTKSRNQRIARLPMGVAMLAGLAIPFAPARAIARHVLHRGLRESTLQGIGHIVPRQRT
jgi:malonate transporter